VAKWADYLISAVRYNAEKTHINRVRLHEDLGEDKMGTAVETSRSLVVANIKNGKTYMTVSKNETTGKYEKGEDVGIVTVNDTEYIRTDANSVASDNLGKLPEF
jgi:hypothetical protein